MKLEKILEPVHFMKHCIGLDYPKIHKDKGSYKLYSHRNHYEAASDSVADVAFQKLEKEGLAVKYKSFVSEITKSSFNCYSLTTDGFKFLELLTGFEIVER